MKRRKYVFVTNEIINKDMITGLEEINSKLGAILLILTKLYGEGKWNTIIVNSAERKQMSAIAQKDTQFVRLAQESTKKSRFNKQNLSTCGYG